MIFAYRRIFLLVFIYGSFHYQGEGVPCDPSDAGKPAKHIEIGSTLKINGGPVTCLHWLGFSSPFSGPHTSSTHQGWRVHA